MRATIQVEAIALPLQEGQRVNNTIQTSSVVERLSGMVPWLGDEGLWGSRDI